MPFRTYTYDVQRNSVRWLSLISMEGEIAYGDGTHSQNMQLQIMWSNCQFHAVAYLGGHGAMPPLADHENFLQASSYEKVRFLPFSSKNCKIQQCLVVFCISKFQKNERICGFH